MWFKVENKRSSTGQRYIVRCVSELGGKRVVEERTVQGAPAARKAAELLTETLNVTATAYGTDAQGEFVYGVSEIEEGAAAAESLIIKRLFAESAAASLSFKDQLLADIPEDTIKGFASMAAALGYIVAQHKHAKRQITPQITYATLFRVMCGAAENVSTYSLPAEDASIALLGEKLKDKPGWMWLSEVPGTGHATDQVVRPRSMPNRVTLNIDGQLQVIRPRTVFRGTVPDSGAQFMLIAERSTQPPWESLGGLGLVYREPDETAVIEFVRGLIRESNPFKNRVVLVNRDLRTVRSRMSARTWNDIIPQEQARAELDFIAASIRD